MSNTGRLGSIWKGRAWDDGEPIPRVTLPDGTIAEAMASMGYAWDGSAYQKLLVDGSGYLKVNVAAGGAGGGAATIADGADVAQGTTTDLSSANTVVGILKAIKAAVTGVLSVSQSGTWTVQPGNTPNTTAWKVDGSAVTQPVSGTFWQVTQPVSGPLTDTQLRATPVPVSGTVTASGPLTDTQLRASAVPISAASLPLPTGATQDATFLAAIGTATVDTPAVNTVIDRLGSIQKSEASLSLAMQSLTNTLTPVPAAPVSPPTLLHKGAMWPSKQLSSGPPPPQAQILTRRF